MSQPVQDKTVRCFLRPAQVEDEPFLFRLFAESQDHLTAFRFNAELYESLIEMQFLGRKQSYGAQFPHAIDAIVCVEDEARCGTPVGRILVDCQPECWRIVDIALLAARRGSGVGSWTLRLCQQHCETAGAKLALAVRPENRARRLYERLGFRATDEDILTVEMEWIASSPSAVESSLGQEVTPTRRTLISKPGQNTAIKIEVYQLHLPGTSAWSGLATPS
jgi:ribosomal protein S18 acetylase RimI-like enzyme